MASVVSVCACSSALTTGEALDGGGAADARAANADGGPSSAASDAARPAEGGDASAADATTANDAAAGHFSCTAASFPSLLAVAEASAAAEVELTPGVRELLVVSDSGHAGAARVLSLASPSTSRAITLPLDAAASDDVEGIAWHDGTLYTLTSSGAVRRFVPDGKGGLERKGDATPIGPAPYACADLGAVNCGKNYEGLCLRANATAHACAGYAASKAEGALHCVVLDGSGALTIDASVAPLALGLAADQLSDCAFGTAGGVAADALVVATNVLNGSRSYRVDEATGALTVLAVPHPPNLEGIAVDHDGSIYLFDDNSTSISAAAKATCAGW